MKKKGGLKQLNSLSLDCEQLKKDKDIASK